ncbi:MAG: hypothetical protein HY738_17010, partial [Bacteroidia bacterium]|nr:hypothetical protein [Bacteroidia bacterium]
MKISASIYANHSKDLRSLIKSLDAHTIDLFHIDCNDDPSVFEDIEFIRQYSGKPVDIHIISPAPWRYFDIIAKNRPEYVTFQYEELDKILKVPDSITSKLGLSIISETDIS